jgi:hypothetical protein
MRASMAWKFQVAERGTTVELGYVVGGYRTGGFKGLASAVDSVIRGQLQRYKRYLESGEP